MSYIPVKMEHLGDGNFGSVSVDAEGHAVKTYFSDAQEAALREITILPIVQSDNVIKMYSTKYTSDVKRVSMERAIGSVHDLITSHSVDGIAQYNNSTCQKIMDTLLTAIQHVHQIGVMHRDVKPENIMILEDGRFKLCDFSLSKFECEAKCHTPRCGTRSYMAPEVQGCAYTQSADLYSCGITILEVITGCLDIPRKAIPDLIKTIDSYDPDWASLLKGLLKEDARERSNPAKASVSSHVSLDPVKDASCNIGSLLSDLDIDDRYHPHLSNVVTRYNQMLKKKFMLEIVVLAACVVFGHTTTEVDACVLFFKNHVCEVINCIRSHSPTALYLCKDAPGPFVSSYYPQEYCPIHSDDDSSDTDSSYSSCSSVQSVSEPDKDNTIFIERAQSFLKSNLASSKLKDMRKAVYEIVAAAQEEEEEEDDDSEGI